MPPKPKETVTLGQELKKRREELGLGIEDAAHEIQAPQDYLRAFEENSYNVFSAKVYALGFLKKLLALLRLENQEKFLLEFGNEWDVQMFRKDRALAKIPENRGEEPLITPAKFWILLAAAALLVVLLFLGLRFARFVSAPRLSLESFKEAYRGPLVNLRGKTAKESSLTVNGRELKLDESGKFDEIVELQSGLNELKFLVENRFGKTNKEVRYILVR